jgi:peptidoglycan/xylan/chitin deacetylase (PgdA/CDA1 family)
MRSCIAFFRLFGRHHQRSTSVSLRIQSAATAMATISILVFTALISAVSAPNAYAASTPCNCVIFRFDDIQDSYFTPVQVAVMDQFIDQNAKVSLAVITNFVGKDPEIVDKVAQGVNSNLFELASHGWNHVDYRTLSLAEQKSTLKMADDKLKSIWGRSSKIFVTPYNHYNADTLQAMKELGLKIISADRDTESEVVPENQLFRAFSGSDIKDTYGIYHLPNTIGYRDYVDGILQKISVDDIISEVNNRIEDYGFAVIMLHPPDFAKPDANGVLTKVPSQQELDDLSDLITYYKTQMGPNSVPYSIKTFSSIANVPIPPPAKVVTHMSDKTATFGLSMNSGRQTHVEFVSATSQLVGDKIDSITLRIKKTGLPTGTAQVGIFNSDLRVTKLFGTISTTSLPTSYADFTFTLSDGSLYDIKSGDRIGIKFNGGNSANSVAVMTDQDSDNPFDGTRSYRQHYTTSWQSFTEEDLYMVLKQTHN